MAARRSDILAVTPVKEMSDVKQRLSVGAPPHLREELVHTMREDVLTAVPRAHGLAGIALVTVDAKASSLAQRYGATIPTFGARDGHTASVAAADRLLAAVGIGGMMQLAGDIPLVTASEIPFVLSMHRAAPFFTIVPSHDEFGSNTVVVSSPNAVPSTFGEDSCFTHIRTAQRSGIAPQFVRLPAIGRDIDNAEDLDVFARLGSVAGTQVFGPKRLCGLGTYLKR